MDLFGKIYVRIEMLPGWQTEQIMYRTDEYFADQLSADEFGNQRLK